MRFKLWPWVGGGGREEGLKATMPTSLLSVPDPQIEHHKYRSHSKGFQAADKKHNTQLNK